MEKNNDTENLEFDLIDTAVIKRYFGLLWQWAWAIALAGALGAVGAFLYSKSQTPIYTTSTRVMVARPAQEQTTDLTRTLSNQQIADTYAQLAKLTPVLQKVSDNLGGIPVESGMISAYAITNTQLVELTVINTDPRQAVAIANELVNVTMEQNDQIQSGRYNQVEANLNTQIADMEKQINQVQEKIDQRNQELLTEQKIELQTRLQGVQDEVTATQSEINRLSSIGTPESQNRVSELRSSLTQLQSLYNSYQQSYTQLVVQGKLVNTADPQLTRLDKTYQLYQQIYVNLINSRESVRLAKLQYTTNVVQLEPPALPLLPVRPNVTGNTIAGLLAGLVLAVVAIFVVDFLDDSIKTVSDVRNLLGLNVMGFIGELDKDPEKGVEGLFVADHPRSPVTESFRTLRTALEFAGVDKPIQSLLVTSAGPGEGKTTIATNLAGVLAQSGKRVLLIDADMRRPNVHRPLGLPNRYGLSDIFRGTARMTDVIQTFEGPNSTTFQVITTGALPPNPAELIASEKMSAIIKEAATLVDILLVDSAPLIVTDPQVLSQRLEGSLIVIHTGETRADATRYAVDQLHSSGGHLLGTVLNRIQRRHANYGTHYAPYYYQNSDYFKKPKSRGVFARFQARLRKAIPSTPSDKK